MRPVHGPQLLHPNDPRWSEPPLADDQPTQETPTSRHAATHLGAPALPRRASNGTGSGRVPLEVLRGQEVSTSHARGVFGHGDDARRSAASASQPASQVLASYGMALQRLRGQMVADAARMATIAASGAVLPTLEQRRAAKRLAMRQQFLATAGRYAQWLAAQGLPQPPVLAEWTAAMAVDVPPVHPEQGNAAGSWPSERGPRPQAHQAPAAPPLRQPARASEGNEMAARLIFLWIRLVHYNHDGLRLKSGNKRRRDRGPEELERQAVADAAVEILREQPETDEVLLVSLAYNCQELARLTRWYARQLGVRSYTIFIETSPVESHAMVAFGDDPPAALPHDLSLMPEHLAFVDVWMGRSGRLRDHHAHVDEKMDDWHAENKELYDFGRGEWVDATDPAWTHALKYGRKWVQD